MNATTLYEILHCFFCAALACWLIRQNIRMPGRPPLYAVTMAIVCLTLGDVYWLAHLVIVGQTPSVLSACDVAYLGIWLMLNSGLPRTAHPTASEKGFATLMGLFILLNCLGWVLWTGSWFINLLWAIPLLWITVRSALRIRVRLRSRSFALFVLSLIMVVAAEAVMYLLPEAQWERAMLLCSLLWLLSMFALIRLVQGKNTLAQLSMPGWMLLLVYCECASFLCTGIAYGGFQLLLLAGFACFSASLCKEGEACHAV